MTRARLAILLVALFILPALIVPATAQRTNGDHHALNVNQPVVLPGHAASVTIHAHPGAITLNVLRVDNPRAFANFSLETMPGALTLHLSRTVSIPGRVGEWTRSVQEILNLSSSGIYLIETTRGEVTQRAWLQVTPFSFILKAGPSRALVYAFDLHSGEPVANASVHAQGGVLGRTGPDGVLELPASAAKGAIVLRSTAGHFAAADLDRAYLWTGERAKVLTMLDRPIYRPGDEVRFKTLSLALDGDRYLPPDGGRVHVRVSVWHRGAETTVHEATYLRNDFGSAAGQFRLDPDAPLGTYGVHVTTDDGARAWSSFAVDAYRTPRVKVDLETPRDELVSGEAVLLRAQASWFFGAPLTRGAVSFEVHAEPVYGGWWSVGRGIHDALTYDPMPRGKLAQGEATLQPDGSALFLFEPLEVPYAVRYVGKATVTAESGEQQTAQKVFTVHPSAIALALSVLGRVVEADGQFDVAAVATRLDGSPARDVPITFTLHDHSDKRARTLTGTTDEAGRAQVTFASAGASGLYGHVALEARAVDDAGRHAVAHAGIWIRPSATVPHIDHGSLDVIPDRARYEPGDTARIVVATARPAIVLLTLEGNDLHDWRVVRVESSTVVEFPLGAKHAPGVTVSAFAHRGPSDARGSGAPFAGDHAQAMLAVSPDPRELEIEVLTEKPTYRDGEEVRLLVRVRDASGNPVVTELAVSVVDAAIHALRADDAPALLEWAYPTERNVATVRAWETFHAHWSFSMRATMGDGFLADDRAVMAMDASSAGEAMTPRMAQQASSEIRIREHFPDTALWLPFVRTDSEGVARIAFTGADTLTQWSVAVRGHTREGELGDAKSTYHTRKPLMVELRAPRFLVEGDVLDVTAVLHNHVGALRDIHVQLQAEGGASLLDKGFRAVTLSDSDSVRLDFPVRVTAGAEHVEFTIFAQTMDGDVEADAHRVRVPVLPHGVKERATRLAFDTDAIVVPVPAGPYSTAPILEVRLAPNLATTALDALPYLLGFPYGCVEQTMSRFMPAVVATRALRDAGYEGVAGHDLPAYTEAGVKRLLDFQHDDGGWGWWKHDPTIPYMTAYVIAGLSEARRAGVHVDAEAFARGVAALKQMHARETDRDLRAYEAYALARAGEPPRSWPAEETLSLDGLALVGLAKLDARDFEGAQAAADALLANMTSEDGRFTWATDTRSDWGIRSDTQRAAHTLRLLTGLGDEANAARLATALAENRVGAHWRTTKDTAESVLAIVEYVRSTGEADPDLRVLVRIDGVEQAFHFKGRGAAAERIVMPVPAHAFGDAVEVDVVTEGRGKLYWSATVTATPRLETIPAASHGFTVTKRLLDASGRPVTDLRFNEEYVAEVRVRAGTTHEYVLLEDHLPAGVEVVKDSPRDTWHGRRIACWDCGWSTWSSTQVLDDRVAAFATRLPPGETVFSYVVRAVVPGSYHALPARVEAMYDPDTWGRSAEAHVNVGAPPTLFLGSATVLDHAVNLEVKLSSSASPDDVRARILGEDGSEIPATSLDVEPGLDGHSNVTLTVESPLPAVMTIEVRTPEGFATRRIDTRGTPHRYEGAFPPDAALAWSAGEVLVVANAPTTSPRAEPFETRGEREDGRGGGLIFEPFEDPRRAPGWGAAFATAAAGILVVVASGLRRRAAKP